MSLKLADSVSWRLVQIFQEAILTGVDGGDLLRQVRLEVSAEDPTVLELTSDYRKQVNEMHQKLEERARELQAEQAGQKLIIDGN